MACILNGADLSLSGDVGDYYFGDGFTSGDVLLALAQVEDDSDLTVYLNSGGGIAYEGAAIHALLSRRAGRTDIVVDGIAASAASLIAMAGDNVTMSSGAVMMIHDPSALTVGDSATHAKTIEGLEALATSYARVYSAKSGKTADECRAIMKAERWYSPEEAVAENFADDTDDTKAKPVAAFDYRTYAHAPQRLTALASKKNWRLPTANERGPAAATGQHKENSMSDTKNGGDTTAENERLKARVAELENGKDAEVQAARDAKLEALEAKEAARENEDAIMALDEAKGNEVQAKALAAAGVKAEAAKGILAAAHKPANDGGDPPLNGAGLGVRSTASGDGRPKPTLKVDLVADMKRRHGVK